MGFIVMIEFNREVIVEREYKVSAKTFMGLYFASCDIDYNDPTKLIIYVHSGINVGNMSYAFDVPYIDGLDINNLTHVKRMIIKGCKGSE